MAGVLYALSCVQTFMKAVETEPPRQERKELLLFLYHGHLYASVSLLAATDVYFLSEADVETCMQREEETQTDLVCDQAGTSRSTRRPSLFLFHSAPPPHMQRHSDIERERERYSRMRRRGIYFYSLFFLLYMSLSSPCLFSWRGAYLSGSLEIDPSLQALFFLLLGVPSKTHARVHALRSIAVSLCASVVSTLLLFQYGQCGLDISPEDQHSYVFLPWRVKLPHKGAGVVQVDRPRLSQLMPVRQASPPSLYWDLFALFSSPWIVCVLH